MPITDVMTRDRYFITRKQEQLTKRKKDGLPYDRMVSELDAMIEKSSANG